MTEYSYDGSLEGLFALLDAARESDAPPVRIRRTGPAPAPAEPREQPDLFGISTPSPNAPAVPAAPLPADPASFPSAAALFELSPGAYYGFVHGWMSELPIEAELVGFARGVFAAADEAGRGDIRSEEARRAAERAASDRGNPVTAIVLEAAYKVSREIDRLWGLLRFTADSRGVYIARCAPDHFVLPAMADYFRRRFGDTPWTIIDEKRRLALVRPPDQEPHLAEEAEFAEYGVPPIGGNHDGDPWEDLWRTYHRTITIENRKNPALQRQFMPVRYWKYLPELKKD
jgi:hypothetical protein